MRYVIYLIAYFSILSSYITFNLTFLYLDELDFGLGNLLKFFKTQII